MELLRHIWSKKMDERISNSSLFLFLFEWRKMKKQLSSLKGDIYFFLLPLKGIDAMQSIHHRNKDEELVIEKISHSFFFMQNMPENLPVHPPQGIKKVNCIQPHVKGKCSVDINRVDWRLTETTVSVFFCFFFFSLHVFFVQAGILLDKSFYSSLRQLPLSH